MSYAQLQKEKKKEQRRKKERKRKEIKKKSFWNCGLSEVATSYGLGLFRVARTSSCLVSLGFLLDY